MIVSTKEDNVQNALEKEFRSIRQTALATTQARSTLGHRRARHLPRSQITVRNARLTKQQKEVLVRYIETYSFNSNLQIIAKSISSPSNSRIKAVPLNHSGKHWVIRFLKSEPDLAAGQFIPFSIDRNTAPSPLRIERWFDYLQGALTWYKIKNQNLYNMDEIGYQLGHYQSSSLSRRRKCLPKLYHSAKARMLDDGRRNVTGFGYRHSFK